jgi:anti-anti-sigma factor
VNSPDPGHAVILRTRDPLTATQALSAHATIRLIPRTCGPTIAVVAGELDLTSADELAGVLCEAVLGDPCGVEVDLAAVEFCDCSSLHALAQAQDFARRCGRRLALEQCSPAVKHVLDVLGLTENRLPTGPRGGATPHRLFDEAGRLSRPVAPEES